MYLTAPLIHNGYEFLPEGSVVEVNDNGTIVSFVYDLQGAEVINCEGILCPGFVNVHCHLELSHLKGSLPEHTGLIPFLKQIPYLRGRFSEEQIRTARYDAFQELLNNGVVAVGDIANVQDTLDLRASDQMHFHSFIECIGFTEKHAAERFDASLQVYNSFAGQDQQEKILRQSIVPHAPYSVSQTVFRLIDGHQPQTLLSIHNQESPEEDKYYKNKTGAVNELLSGFGIDDSFFLPSGRTSVQTYLPWISAQHSCIFVHNTYTTEEDVQMAKEQLKSTYWCLCPNANLYIEDRLPDVNMFRNNTATICIGTDSLASNHQLSVLSELKTLKKHYHGLAWNEVLRWGTLNGATALQMLETVGSISPGKVPGVINIIHPDADKPLVRRIA